MEYCILVNQLKFVYFNSVNEINKKYMYVMCMYIHTPYIFNLLVNSLVIPSYRSSLP